MLDLPEELSKVELPEKDYRKRGFWVMVKRQIPVEIPVEPLGIYYATPVIRQAAGRYKGNIKAIDMNYMCEITTQYGDVTLNDYEFTLIPEEKLLEYLQCVANGSYELRMYGQTRSYKTKLKEQIFYIQSRGIPYQSAVLMVLGNIRKRNVLYLHPKEEYQRYFIRNIDFYFKRRDEYLKKYNGPHYTVLTDNTKAELLKQYLNNVENETEDSDDSPDSE